ncbi:hypothetical protein LIER_20245 [Lithospermum erythrorhizon]|uniref:Retrotransposon gag domain-containing protein n=1 Tax=Lithospermum erythrorhizon TaxID=34254 RepID=A0AAV3QPX7_LITER
MSFFDRLDNIALSAVFKLPQFNLFDGNGDPLKHLKGFIAHIAITSNNPGVYAKEFPNSLTGKALDWYMKLPLKSLDSYQETTDTFVAKFGTAIQSIQDERILMDIRQNINEPLSSYYKRYNELLLSIPAVDDKAKIGHSNRGAVIAHPANGKEAELKGIELPHDDPVVIAPLISNFTMERMLVDIGSSADILYLKTFGKLQLPRSHIQPIATPLTGLTGHVIYLIGIVALDFTVVTGDRNTTIKTQFTVVDIDDSSYNNLIGRPTLTALRAIVSPLHLKMKFQTARGIGEMCGNQNRARICYQASVSPVNKPMGRAERNAV